MFLDDLCYIKGGQVGAPALDFSTPRKLLRSLKNIFSAPPIIYDKFENGVLTVNAGLSFDPCSIFEFSDGVNTIYSRLEKIDANKAIVINDISILKSGFIFSYPKMQYIIEEEVTSGTIENQFFKIMYSMADAAYQHVETILIDKIEQIQTVFNSAFMYNADNTFDYEFIYNDVFIFIKVSQNGAYTPFVFLMQENISLCRNMGVALNYTSQIDYPWVSLSKVGSAKNTFHFSARNNINNRAPLTLNNYLALGEKIKYIYNYSGGLPDVANKKIYKKIVNDKLLAIFYSSDAVYDNGYYVMGAIDV